MRKVWQWGVASNERAVENARVAAVECSRRRVEAAEAADYVMQRRTPVAELVPQRESLRSIAR